MVCIGEGEESMRMLAERMDAGKDPKDVRGIGFRGDSPFGNSHKIINPVVPLRQDLDDYPFPDYELHTHWVVEKGQLRPAGPANLRGALHRFRIETTRGCPYTCNFCNNTAWQNIYKGQGPWVRMRSNDNVIEELEKALASYPTIESVNVLDDLFFVRSVDEMKDFAEKYRRRVNLPIELDAHPNLLTEEKLAALEQVPIALISMGIQSGSLDTLKSIYKRHTPIDKIIKGIDLLSGHGFRAEYHYLINNPYEADDNVVETMRFISNHHKGPATLRIFPLMFYPGTPLYDRARQDGLIELRHEAAYNYTYTGRLQFAMHDYLSTWLRVVLHMRNAGLPRWLTHRLIDMVTSKPVRWFIDRKYFTPIAFRIYQVFRKIYKNLIYKPFIRPAIYLRGKLRRRERQKEDSLRKPDQLMDVESKQSISRRQRPGIQHHIPIWTLPRPDKHQKVASMQSENTLTPDNR